ncbi:MAG: winged helix-turn-helix transcriptional regulator [Chitinophagaceae bacterium]|nr:winged helix-turn-helix transcriptional regulator [Chitinophagaceae bacterium]
MKHSDFDPKYQNQHVESRIVAALEKISQAFRVLLWQESREFALSPIQVQVLIFLLHHSTKKGKVSYLAREFNMTRATISDTVKSLDQKGLIQKLTVPKDGRSYHIQLSEKGREMAVKASLFTNEIHTPVDQLHPDDKENLLLSLLNIIRHLNRAGIITIPRMCMTCAYYQSQNENHKHFCHLLHQELQVTDLRLDCPEHKAIT